MAEPVRHEPRTWFAAPRTLKDVIELLTEDPSATLWGGGTDLMVQQNRSREAPGAVVALRRVTELAAFEPGRVGAAVTFQRLEASNYHVALAQAARAIGSRQIRVAGTLGGNLGTASPAGDSLPVLLAYEARVRLRSAAGARDLPLDQFLTGPRATARRSGEVIEAALISPDLPRAQAFGKIGQRNAMTISLVSACVTRASDGATKVALGSVAPTPIRARRAEQLISAERTPSAAALAEFARLVSEEISPISDLRTTADYRRLAAGVLARRLLMRCL